MLDSGFLGKDDRVDGVGGFGRRDILDIFGSVGHEGADEVGYLRRRHRDIIMVQIEVHCAGCVVISAVHALYAKLNEFFDYLL
jgi:hypothetical protein